MKRLMVPSPHCALVSRMLVRYAAVGADEDLVKGEELMLSSAVVGRGQCVCLYHQLGVMALHVWGLELGLADNLVVFTMV